MSVKRRDNKGRILRTGESQRKDGRYMYKYVDNAGKVRYVYSWRLVKTDPLNINSILIFLIRNFLMMIKSRCQPMIFLTILGFVCLTSLFYRPSERTARAIRRSASILNL